MKVTFSNECVENQCRILTRLLRGEDLQEPGIRRSEDDQFVRIIPLRRKGLIETISGKHVLTPAGEGMAHNLEKMGI